MWDDKQISKERAGTALASSIESFEKHNFGLWTVVRNEHEELIGFCGSWFLNETPQTELLNGLAAPYWGSGLATEAARAVIRYGFEAAGFDRIETSADTENAASLRVMLKAGMEYERRALRGDQGLTYYAISREAFQPDDAPYVVRHV